MRRTKANPQTVFEFEETAAPVPETVLEGVPEPPATMRVANVLEVFDGRYLEDEAYDEAPQELVVFDGRTMAGDPEDEPVPAPLPIEPPPINPQPSWRGPFRVGTRPRRFFLLSYPNRMKRKGNDVYGSLFQLGVAMMNSGFEPPIIMLDNIDEIHTKKGGIYPDDVLVFLSSDLDLVEQYAKRQFHWCNGAFVHCIASTDEDIPVLWSYLVSLGCAEHKLHILRVKGGYAAHPSNFVAERLWARLAPIYSPTKEDSD